MRCRHYFHLHFIVEETEVQGGLEKLDSRPHGYLQVRIRVASAHLLLCPGTRPCPALGAWLTLTPLTDHHLPETFPSPTP